MSYNYNIAWYMYHNGMQLELRISYIVIVRIQMECNKMQGNFHVNITQLNIIGHKAIARSRKFNIFKLINNNIYFVLYMHLNIAFHSANTIFRTYI